MSKPASVIRRITSYAKSVGGALMGLGPYRGGDVTRLNRSWQPGKFSGEGAIKDAWDLLTRRIRDLGRNDPTIIALENAIVNNVIRTGIGTIAASAVNGEPDDEFNDEADDGFEWWGIHEADIQRRVSHQDQQRQLLTEVCQTGEAILLRCIDPDWRLSDPMRTVPLCYQVLEAEQIDETKDQSAGKDQNEIIRGIEVDSLRRPVAYWLWDIHPSDPHASYNGKSSRVPADRVIHLTIPGRPSKIRGISLHAAITQSARDLDNYLGSELTSATIASLLTIVHKTDTPGTGLGFAGDGSDSSNTDEAGNNKVRLGRGIVCQIPKGDEVAPVASNRPNSNSRPFIDLILMLTAMGGGVSKYRLTRDYSATTYVAARAARLDDADAFEPMQQWFGRRVCLPVRMEWTRQMAAFGKFRSLSASQFLAQARRWLAAELLFPGVDQIDPEKETDSDLAALGAGTVTFRDVYARKGKNYRRELRQRAKEEKYIREELKLELNLARPSTPPKRASDQPADQANQPSTAGNP